MSETLNDDLIEIGVAYMHQRNGIEKALRRLETMRKDDDLDMLTRADLLNVILILREAME